MKSESESTPKKRIGDNLRFSLVFKLNIKLWFRLLRQLIILNLIICLVSALGLVVRAEQTAAAAAEMLEQTGFPIPYSENWLELTGCNISQQTEKPDGFLIPDKMRTYFPEVTAEGVREIDLPDWDSLTSWSQLEDIAYHVTIGHDGLYYRISIRPYETLKILAGMFAILLLAELIMLIRSMISGSRTIRKTLRPIEVLAQTAHNLNANGVFAPEQLEVLAGKLDDINATRLDTRIPVSETQSELKTLASAINGMLDRINESYRSQVRFVSDASHELRTPISVIQGYANLLDRWGKNDEKTLQESIDAIKEETANMKGLVEQLLFLARGDNNTMSLQIERFDLSALALEILKETQMIDSGHEYDSNVQTVFIDADKSLIKQAARILIDNAMKYTPTGKRITISVQNNEGLARLSIQDEGIGIPPEAVAKIFDRFFRTDESRARATGGAGLGLSIAKWITERHGGHMEVLSRQDIGTRISIVLPKAN
ncbi:histidine kinase,HAMP domain-containing protein,histidine kinase [Desulfosporosinus orientis DSM 765]|uniref:histidine kinase n=1 Tax=Desulfosporosinus orientis (strain ATCC 19365 / DSM 765 / NCIMB 8382 / VKM B-1628 / Singapore I) TaxID=768706 RepID=G7WFZ7_DESOD|nr:HAMP domain-containing sensor histidine kinase [Desulfosporosinus orientis]AET69512.1 histidine kinase,HAMP domain-containing protein,histidine kinase [Desulfosporosinus orientis DSM 765]